MALDEEENLAKGHFLYPAVLVAKRLAIFSCSSAAC